MEEEWSNCTDCLVDLCSNITLLTYILDNSPTNESLSPEVEQCLQTNGLPLAMVLPYALFFLLSVVGNALVISTLWRHKKMRTITNVYLLNLSLSDLLLAVFCMPFTLVPLLLQDFIFGETMCILIRYLQAVSVGVSCFTLVAISLERYFAICRPLESRRWQTLSHSYRSIVAIWAGVLVLMLPTAIFTKAVGLRTGKYACREVWSSPILEKLYTCLLDVLLLVCPLLIMGFSYGRVARELWRDTSFAHSSAEEEQAIALSRRRGSDVSLEANCLGRQTSSGSSDGLTCGNGSYQHQYGNFRQANYVRILASKRRVVKMLCVVVLEYFVCWTPLFVVNTWSVVDYISARAYMTLVTKSVVFLMAYLSSCIHPITYCFMNRKFRQSFLAAFACCAPSKAAKRLLSESSHGKTSARRATNVTTFTNADRRTSLQ